MTLGSETAAILRQGLDALMHIMGPAPHEHLSTAERMSALTHLTVTANAAAKLADAARAEILALPAELGGETQYIRAETERLRAEAGKVEKDTKWAWQETERLKAQVEKVRAETEKMRKGTENVAKEVESSLVETIGPKLDMKRLEKYVNSSMMEKERAEAERVASDLKRSAEESKGLRVELDRVRKERSTIESEVQQLTLQLETVRSQKAKMQSNGGCLISSIVRVIEEMTTIEKSLERLAPCTEKFKAMEDEMGKSIENSEQETKRLQGVLDILRSETVLQSVVEC